ncbi:hypothetical protein B4070_1200 [Bacillus subtilis]|nr:hypothetical protein B4070_1200 [Bacillus subtilis]
MHQFANSFIVMKKNYREYNDSSLLFCGGCFVLENEKPEGRQMQWNQR